MRPRKLTWRKLALTLATSVMRVASVAILLMSTPALAVPFTAQITDVADAVDVDNLFDFNASVGFRRVVKNTRITREALLQGGDFGLADVLAYSVTSQILDIRASVGLFHDLELNFFLPYTLTQTSTWDHSNNDVNA